MAKKVALITGSGRGIGRAIALKLSEDGFDVVISDIRESNVKSVVEEITKAGRTALAYPLDVTKEADVKKMFETVIAKFSRLDVLVTAAGITSVNTIDDLNGEVWEKVLAVNAKGTYLCMVEAGKQMIKQKSGKIITVGSDYAIQGAKNFVCYSASKFAVRGMTQAFAKELAPYNINVNCIAPGIIWTDMWAEADDKLTALFGFKKGEAFEKTTKDVVLLPKPGKPEYIAPVVAFLASEGADYITAATIPIGGGSIIF